jgi:acyl-CoA dehydrogenase
MPVSALADQHTSADEDVSTLLLDQADKLFEQHVTKDSLLAAERGEWPGEIWAAVSEAGLHLALVREEVGGFGLAPAQALLLVRRAAYHTLPLPLAETMVAAALWSAASGQIPEGILTLAPTGTGQGPELSRTSGGYRLEGRLDRVPWGGEADHILVFARDRDGLGHLALVPRPDGEIRERRNVAFEPRPTIALTATELPQALVRPAPPICADGMLVFGALLRAQQMVGAMERCLEYALAFATERKQFGRPIGKFQAVQHLLAEAAGEFAASAAAADGAAHAWAGGSFAHATALAKARVGEASGKVAAICHQVHGAMGFTHEHPLHFFTRRLWSWRDEFGGEAYWQERIGRSVCADGGEALWDTLVRVTQAGRDQTAGGSL